MWFAFSEVTLTVGGGENKLKDWVAEREDQKVLKFTKIKYGCG